MDNKFTPLNLLYSMGGGLISTLATAFVFGYLGWRREQRARAVELLEKFLTSEAMLKARLVTQEYLVPGVDRAKYRRFAEKDFEEINELLEQGTHEEKENRVHIRAIPSFFWLVDQAMRSRVIQRNPHLWSRTYSFYWVNVIQPRSRKSHDPLYKRFDWMLLPEDVNERTTEYELKRRQFTEPSSGGQSSAGAGLPRVS